jgi:Cu-Zn family superoxide dismutase
MEETGGWMAPSGRSVPVSHLKKFILIVPGLLLGVLLVTAVVAAKEEKVADAKAARAEGPIRAVCVLRGTMGNRVRGRIVFVQQGDMVRITGQVRGLTPGKHGFHVHEFGDISAPDGTATGGHYNPTGKKHGKPSDEERHVGDLGNIEANAEGLARINMTDKVIKLSGPHSIIGRGMIVHAKPDDFGQPTGNAGARVAQGVVGLAGPAKKK